jgi:transposase InsO family protein
MNVPAIDQLPIAGYASDHDITARRVRLTVASARPISAADMAQARLFDDILQSEIAELEELAAYVEARWQRLHEQRRREELRRVHARLDEARRLLDALRDRFTAV